MYDIGYKTQFCMTDLDFWNRSGRENAQFIAILYNDGGMTCNFTPFLTVFQSYKDDGLIIMKGCAQWNSVLYKTDLENYSRLNRSV